MKIGLIAGFTIGAMATSMLLADMKMMRIVKKTKKAVVHKMEDMWQ